MKSYYQNKPLLFNLLLLLIMNLVNISFLQASVPKTLEVFHDESRKNGRPIGLPETTQEQLNQLNILPAPTLSIEAIDETKTEHTVHLSGAKDQGDSLACLSFSTVACLESLYLPKQFSEAHLAKLVNVETENECDSSGALFMSTSMAYARDKGVVESKYWPFDDSNICGPTPQNFSSLKKVRFGQVYTLFNTPTTAIIKTMLSPTENITMENPLGINALSSAPQNSKIKSIRRALLLGAPVAIEIPLFYDSNGVLMCNWGNGIGGITMPGLSTLNTWIGTNNVDRSEAWHAITIYAYDDKKVKFSFKNSWKIINSNGNKEWWGTYGFSTIPYEYIIQYARIAMYGSKIK